MSSRIIWLDRLKPFASLFHRNVKQSTGGVGTHIIRRQINIAGNEALKQPASNSKQRSPLAYLFLAFPVATFCLGTWQIYRLQWKVDLIDKLERMLTSSPVELADCLTNIENQEYIKVKVQGYLDTNSIPMFIFPRSLLKAKKPHEREGGTGLISTSNATNIGAQLILPFVITDTTTKEAIDAKFGGAKPRILVNLGWVSKDTMDKLNNFAHKRYENSEQLDEDKQSANNKTNTEIELVGVIRKSEKREPFRHKQEYNFGYWNRRDIGKMCEVQSTVPIFLDASMSYPVSLFEGKFQLAPVGGQTRVNLRNEHLSYILTWYSLTALFSFLWLKKIFKSRL